MKKTLIGFCVVLLVFMAAETIPAAADPSGPQSVLQIEGPDAVQLGDIVEVRIKAPAACEGLSTVLEAEGLDFLESTSAMCSEKCLILLPGMGMEEVTYRYRVRGDAKIQIVCTFSQLTITINGVEYPCSTELWTCPVMTSPAAFEDMLSPAAITSCVYADSAQTDHFIIEGSSTLTSGTFTELRIRANGTSEAMQGELLLDGLTALSVPDKHSGRNPILTVRPGNGGELRIPCLVTAASGSKATAVMRGNGGTDTTWSRIVTKELHNGLTIYPGTLLHPEFCYDLLQNQTPLTVLRLRFEAGLPETWSIIVYAPDGRKRTESEHICNNDRFTLNTGNESAQIHGCIHIRGDLLRNGHLDILQIVKLAQLLSSNNPPEEFIISGDLNKNSYLDIGDLTLLATALSQKEMQSTSIQI